MLLSLRLHVVFAGVAASPTELLTKEVSKLYPNAKISFLNEINWVRGDHLDDSVGLSVIGDDSRGNIHFSITHQSGAISEGWVAFAAWVPARVPIQRIKPGQALSPELFVTQEVNVSTGPAREYRGVILPADYDLNGLEAMQTILEGQFLTSSSVQRVPDVRRGDSIRIHLISGELTLSTLGIAEEPAYMNKQVRVMTTKSKRELSGYLRSGGVVEVKL
jgi:flagella basal body P-ring formation protein FlgA